MKTLAEIVVGTVAFLQFDDAVDPDIAIGQLHEIGLQLLEASDEERRAVLDVCRAMAATLPRSADPEVKLFYESFGRVFELEPE